MAEYISFQPSDYYKTKIYAGTGSTATITGVGFQPDFTWIKNRDDTYWHNLIDNVRGSNKYLFSNVTNVEGTHTDRLTSWNSDGFVLSTDGNVNASGDDLVSWNWKAGTTSGIATNGSTTITPSSYSFNQTSGMSVIAYTGNSTNDGQKVPHGLGAPPEFIIIKQIDGTSQWSCYHKSLGNTKALSLSTTAAAETDAGTGSYNFWYRTSPDSVNFTIGSSHYTNMTSDMIAYCFTPKKGYSKMGSYIGTASTDGPFIYLGFRPAFILLKKSTGISDWQLIDDKRLGYNVDNNRLKANENSAESTGDYLDLVSNGFKIRSSSPDYNTSGTYIYMAFAEFPLVSSNDIPGVAR